jgi:hypothetical protein
LPSQDANVGKIDYIEAVSDSLKRAPKSASRTALAQDFAAMRADGLLPSDVLEFDAILETCAAIQDKVKRLACGQPLPSSMQITNERTQTGLMLSLLGVIAEQSTRSPRELPVNDCVRCLPTTTFLQQLPLSVLFILATFPAAARACEPRNHSTRTAIGADSPRRNSHAIDLHAGRLRRYSKRRQQFGNTQRSSTCVSRINGSVFPWRRGADSRSR